MSSVKKSCICAVCVALCYVLPISFHSVGLGTAFSPMHLPVLLCGLLCGWPYGALCGVVGPVLSSVLSAMPPASALVHMIPELCAYGLFSGLLAGHIRTGRASVDLYLSLIPAMLLGRIVGGVAQAAFYLSNAKGYSLALWASSYLVKTAPAIVLQLVVIPPLVLALMRAGVVPPRYAGEQVGR